MSNDDKPIQIIRDSQICVSYTVRSALNYVAQASGTTNIDQLAENVLTEWLSANHANVLEHIEIKHAMDRVFRLELKKKLNLDPFEPKQ